MIELQRSSIVTLRKREGSVKSFLSVLLIGIGVLIFLSSFVVPTTSMGIVFLVLACAFVANGLVVRVANRKYKTL